VTVVTTIPQMRALTRAWRQAGDAARADRWETRARDLAPVNED